MFHYMILLEALNKLVIKIYTDVQNIHFNGRKIIILFLKNNKKKR